MRRYYESIAISILGKLTINKFRFSSIVLNWRRQIGWGYIVYWFSMNGKHNKYDNVYVKEHVAKDDDDTFFFFIENTSLCNWKQFHSMMCCFTSFTIKSNELISNDVRVKLFCYTTWWFCVFSVFVIFMCYYYI